MVAGNHMRWCLLTVANIIHTQSQLKNNGCLRVQNSDSEGPFQPKTLSWALTQLLKGTAYIRVARERRWAREISKGEGIHLISFQRVRAKWLDRSRTLATVEYEQRRGKVRACLVFAETKHMKTKPNFGVTRLQCVYSWQMTMHELYLLLHIY